VRYAARAPLRIDFGGGWTDVPLFAAEEGGAVLTAAITRYVRGSISRPTASGLVGRLRSERSYLSYSLDVPAGAGLGASAAQTVLWATLVKSSIANVSDRSEIAEIAWGIGNLLGIMGGKQDEYASALGGITYFRFGETVEAEHLTLPSTFIEALRARLVLVYTGQRAAPSAVHAAVWEQYRRGDQTVSSALRALKGVAGGMREALGNHDIEGFGELIAENWRQQQRLHVSVSTPAIDSMLSYAVRHGALAGKACGAGGGGCVVLVAGRGREEELRAALSAADVPTIDFDFDTYGVFLTKG
jgi:D-glycero-alpha-D-manno-heptose-7-phosphate kinase